MLKKHLIILASESSLRKEYFKMMSLPFEVMPSKIDESHISSIDPKDITRELAVKKVEKILEKLSKLCKKRQSWIFAADTVITMKEKIYGKPANREEAFLMIKDLSGKSHKAITSIALYNPNTEKIDVRSAECSVTFLPLTDKEINWYIDTNEWRGAAGAYRIQGLAGCFIQEINGNMNAVSGLPLNEFYAILKDNGYEICIP